jgi:copper resistance protein C
MTLGGIPQASAHAFLNASVPSPDSTVTTPLKEIKLSYSEPVEIRFSIFKVYKLNSGPGADMGALHTAAAALMAADLLKRGDEADRSDAGVANTTTTSTEIVVRLKELEPGAYAVLWRALSVDTHTTQGDFVFIYAPAGSWAPLNLPSDPLAAAFVQVGAPTEDRLPLRLQPPELPAVGITFWGLAGQSVLSLEPVAGLQDLPVDTRPPTPGIDAAPPPGYPTLDAASSDPPLLSLPSNIQVSGIMLYRFIGNSVSPVAGGNNLNDITPSPYPTLSDGTLEVAVNWTLSPSVSVFADLSPEYNTDMQWAPSDIEEAFIDVHDLLDLPGFGVRLGRDRIKLGFDGLLLDEGVFDSGRRDGVEMRETQLGPVSILGFMQYAVDDGLQVGNWSSTRRVWGARAEAQVVPGWMVGVSYRADTAEDGEVGPCPGIGCNVGSGFSAGVEGNLTAGVDLIVEAATYTRLGDIARYYYESDLALNLQQLLRIQSVQPVLTFWYKNFDPYTAPLDAPLGHLLTPDDFGLFNTNDNLTAGGARLDVALTPVLSVFALAEAGTYKDAGPNYYVYSFGVKYSLSTNTLIKAAYNAYWVAGGVVTTSPVTGLQLSDDQIVEVDLQRAF